MPINRLRLPLFISAVWFAGAALGACVETVQPTPTGSPPRDETLTPYTVQQKSSSTPLPPSDTSQSILPSPTPTPLRHTVVKGEDLFGIALRYGLTVEEIKAANPDVNPNFLSIGTVLIIPADATSAPTAVNPTPTPVPLQISSPDCWPSTDGGITCLAIASNPSSTTLENVVVRIRVGGNSGEMVEQEAYGLLNLLPPGESLPISAYFPGPITSEARGSAELLSVFPLPEGDSRYIPLKLNEVKIDIPPNGLSANVQGQAVPQNQANIAWIAAWAKDAQGRLVAVRRWESPGVIAENDPEPFGFTLYSLGGSIAEVKLLGEARP